MVGTPLCFAVTLSRVIDTTQQSLRAQNGWQSQGFEDYYLADQESRVRYFHGVLNDYLAGHKGV